MGLFCAEITLLLLRVRCVKELDLKSYLLAEILPKIALLREALN